jgi:hypothetical protein
MAWACWLSRSAEVIRTPAVPSLLQDYAKSYTHSSFSTLYYWSPLLCRTDAAIPARPSLRQRTASVRLCFFNAKAGMPLRLCPTQRQGKATTPRPSSHESFMLTCSLAEVPYTKGFPAIGQDARKPLHGCLTLTVTEIQFTKRKRNSGARATAVRAFSASCVHSQEKTSSTFT